MWTVFFIYIVPTRLLAYHSRDWAWFKLAQPIAGAQAGPRLLALLLIDVTCMWRTSRLSCSIPLSRSWLLLSNKRPLVLTTPRSECAPLPTHLKSSCLHASLYFSITRKSHGPDTFNNVSNQLCCITHTYIHTSQQQIIFNHIYGNGYNVKYRIQQ
jgi:hypothetical protein